MSKAATTPRPGEPQPALMRALKWLLRPLVRVLIAQGITLPTLLRLLKEVYVEVGESQFVVPGRRQTDSRINLLTGVHRKDIRALRGRGRPDEGPSPVVSRNAQMIALWAGDPEYVDSRGRPRALPRNAAKGGGASFEGLVRSVSKDIRPRVVFDEWQRLDLIRVDNNGLVHLNNAAFVPREDFADLAYYFGRNLRDHIAASGHNLLGSKPALLERAVYYEKLTAKSVDALSARARKIGSQAIIAVNRKAFDLARRDSGVPEASQRMTFGIYFLSAEQDPQDVED